MNKMTSEPKAYFRRFVPHRDSLLNALEEEAREERIPIVGPLVGELLYVIARAMGARKVLELGTATGYSTIYLARACETAEGRVVTVEWDREMAQRAKKNLERAGITGLVEIVVGDALKVMATMKGPFDLIFMDVDKEYYLDALAHCYRLLRVGGLLFTDNVGFRLSDAFNRELFNHPDWRVVNLLSFLPEHSPEEDGISLALRTR